MIIKKIKLENIRSYIDQEIELPQGSLLLSGDIGSGKSTVLLAIDFALFGIRKSDLTGASLLRNGTKNGSVELHFEVDGKNVVIKRTLKRTSSSVAQDSGFVMIDGVKKEGTAVELKQTILDLLNYPKELLTKSKSLIHKYTIYTPQEEMKQILVENKDLRLDTLRKVFGIDKYKKIKENTKVLTSAIKEKKKEFAGMIFDLEQRKGELTQKQEELQTQNKKLEDIQPMLEILRQDLEKKKKEIEETENQIKEINEIKKQLEVKTLEQKTKENKKTELEDEFKTLTEQISNTEVKKVVEENFDTQINAKQEKILLLEKETQDFLSEIVRLKTQKDHSEQLKTKIVSIENCPTCEQQVTQEHKNLVQEREDNRLNAINKKLSILEQNYQEKQTFLTKIKEDLEQLKERKSNVELDKLKYQNLEEKKKKKEQLQAQQEIVNKEVEELKKIILNLEQESQKYSNIEENYKVKRQELEIIQEKKSAIDQEEALVRNDIKNIDEKLTGLKEEIEKKEKVKQNLLNLTQLQEWIEKQFVNLMEVIEKNIMLKVHNDFDGLFQRWFNMIIEEGALQSKLDASFTPIIDQNGHDIDYPFLSGGEKTAIALAYRLALNQVINKLMRNIKTNDLLILDEPTDGFSNEQLDKVKDVIEDLDLKQIIIVSHEPKVESFVNHTIKFKKENHISQAITQ